MTPHAMMALGGLVVLVAYVVIAFPRRPKSGFRIREADRLGTPPVLANSMEPSGLAHEILGVSPSASRREILSAHKKLMKRYHPDKIAEAGTPAWENAQALASRINAAKEEMLAGFKK